MSANPSEAEVVDDEWDDIPTHDGPGASSHASSGDTTTPTQHLDEPLYHSWNFIIVVVMLVTLSAVLGVALWLRAKRRREQEQDAIFGMDKSASERWLEEHQPMIDSYNAARAQCPAVSGEELPPKEAMGSIVKATIALFPLWERLNEEYPAAHRLYAANQLEPEAWDVIETHQKWLDAQVKALTAEGDAIEEGKGEGLLRRAASIYQTKRFMDKRDEQLAKTKAEEEEKAKAAKRLERQKEIEAERAYRALMKEEESRTKAGRDGEPGRFKQPATGSSPAISSLAKPAPTSGGKSSARRRRVRDL